MSIAEQALQKVERRLRLRAVLVYLPVRTCNQGDLLSNQTQCVTIKCATLRNKGVEGDFQVVLQESSFVCSGSEYRQLTAGGRYVRSDGARLHGRDRRRLHAACRFSLQPPG